MAKLTITIEDLEDGEATTNLHIDKAGSIENMDKNTYAQTMAIGIASYFQELGIKIPIPAVELQTQIEKPTK